MSKGVESRIGSLVVGVLLVAGVLAGFEYFLPGQAASQAGYHPMAAPATPVRLVVPSLKIRAPIQPIRVDSQGVLDPPHNPRDVGWWQRSTRPGADHGQTVLTGHTVHTGGGVMDHLGRLHRGDLVKVVTRHGTMVYRATQVTTMTKPELAKRSVELFSQKRHENRLVLITCTGWTGHDYTSNVVVFADPLGVRDVHHRTKAS